MDLHILREESPHFLQESKADWWCFSYRIDVLIYTKGWAISPENTSNVEGIEDAAYLHWIEQVSMT